jgi:Arc/MetJ-type ribon-helix-helix transcriptional regulator
MKLSVSLPDDDVRFLDEFVDASRAPSRSAALHRAVRLLRAGTLQDDYAAAFDEWNKSGDAAAWESTAADGMRRR